MKMSKLLPLLAVSGALAACSSVSTLNPVSYSGGYSASEAQNAALSGTVNVEVLVQDETTQQATEQAVTAALNKHGPKWIVTRFESSSKSHSRYKLRYIIDAPVNLNPIQICSLEEEELDFIKASSNGDVVIGAALCRDTHALSYLRGRLLPADKPGTEAFTRVIGETGRTLMRNINPNRDDCSYIDCD